MSTSFADELLDELDEGQNEGARSQEGEENGNDGWGKMEDDGEHSGVDDMSIHEESDGTSGEGEAQSLPVGQAVVAQEAELSAAEVEQLDLRPEKIRSIHEVCTLPKSQRLRQIMLDIDRYSSSSKGDFEGVLEDSPEYRLIVEANNLVVSVDNEIMVVHKFIRQQYKPRFPELESLISNPWEFVQAVRAIGNSNHLSSAAQLEGILPHGTVVVISMQASTTKGRKLSMESWQNILEACEVSASLDKTRSKILEYVESRMTVIAPNLSKVVGSRVATKLLGIAGGLVAFIKIPACNVLLLGASNKTAAGMSTAFSGRHEGFVAQAPLVANSPPDILRQAMRTVSAKALLAARVDASGSDRHGTYGAQLAQELEKKLEKLQEPPPSKMIKVLPVPKEGANPKQRRGGRRARKAKERNGMTELRKLQNRVRFGEAEEEVGAFDESVGMGMINSKGDTGRLRVTTANEASKSRMSKRNTHRIQAMRLGGGALNRLESEEEGRLKGEGNAETSGTASSLAFTPFQGIELVDPSRQRKVEEANAKWFKEGTFSLAPGARTGASERGPHSTSFAIPEAPSGARKSEEDVIKRARLV